MSVTMPPASAAGHSWLSHFRETFALGIPLIGAQLAQQGINATDIFILGQLSALDLAAAVLATQYYFTIFIFGMGLAIAVMPMVAQAYGRGDEVAVRRSMRMGMWASIIYSVLSLPLFFWAEPILLALGQEPDVAAKAAQYLFVVGFALFPALLFQVLRSLVSATGHARVVLWVSMLTLVVNAVVAYGLVLGGFGMPQLGIRGAAIATFVGQAFGFLYLVAYIGRDAMLARYALFVRFWKPDWQALREVVLLGLPIGISVLAEVSMFTVSSVLMGQFGTVPLAAHGIAIQLSSITFMVPLGLSQAATVRVGVFHGANDRANVTRASAIVMVVAIGFAVASGLAFAFAPRALSSLFIDVSLPDAAAVIAYAAPLIVIAALFQLLDTAQVIMNGFLRGLKDTRIPMVLVLIAYWIIGLPVAWLLAFPAGLGGIGIWIGFLCGLGAAAVMLSIRYWRLLQKTQG
ncbi:MATE family efflux transporter [Martelella sp. AD-3]|uniref:MATE family efflux transporter n=1 Tax=Martelella sp. AD-3 TaxID=686597 RepID=UPI0006870FBC|nr:MATE family efflux transporter [Martelella sp. AD-3]AMM85191.1 MATE family efflux transporter [Martelella sp. AD-3]